MNTGKLERFAKEARNTLLAEVERKLRYWGFDETGHHSEPPVDVQGGYIFRGQLYDDPDVPDLWQSLRHAVSAVGFRQVIEKAAYVWFNRLLAIKILSKNGYEPALLEYQDENVLTPQVLVKARRGQYTFLSDSEKRRLEMILPDYANETKAFSILLIGFCHSHTLLKEVFGLIDDYSELLLPDDILSENGFLHLLNTTDAITDDDYRQVELIGWLYQFYISDKKDEVFKGFKNNKKAEASDIPAATQIFTPNWIVKYMVENTVGRIWLDHKPDSPLRQSMKYLVEPPVEVTPPPSGGGREGVLPAQDNKEVLCPSPSGEGVRPRRTDEVEGGREGIISEVSRLKLLDPASGSGHILVEGFELLFEMYQEEYYSTPEAVESILRNNLFGLDIDLRAVQLARFAILLKAATKYPDILKSGIMPQVYAMPEPCEFTRQDMLDFLGDTGTQYIDELSKVLTLMQQAQNLGSIMRFDIPQEARDFIVNRFHGLQQKSSHAFFEESVLNRITPFIQVFEVMSRQYEAVAANPPYMVSGNMNSELRAYAESNYPLTKGDLFSVFMDVSRNLILSSGCFGMINQTSWMFKTSYKRFREVLKDLYVIKSMLHLGPRVFDEISGEVVQSTAFVISKENYDNKIGYYYRLTEPRNSKDKKHKFLHDINKPFRFDLRSIERIPEKVLGYWISSVGISIFSKSKSLDELAEIKKGVATGDDKRFLRLWSELPFNKIEFNSLPFSCGLQSKWIPVNKGGGYRKWSGNTEYVINWEYDGKEIKAFKGADGRIRSRPQNLSYNFLEGITYNIVASNGFTGRIADKGFMMCDTGPTIYNSSNPFAILSLLNSKVAQYFFDALCPGYKYDTGAVGRLPIFNISIIGDSEADSKCQDCISISKEDWDSHETSWDFQQHLLVTFLDRSLEQCFQKWLLHASRDFFQLHRNEEELNSIFIDIYGLQDELTPDVYLKDITILQDELDYASLEKLEPPYEGQLLPIKKEVVMQQLISYAIGCYMGRYRLDKPGLHIAHPNPTTEELAPYAISLPRFLSVVEEQGEAGRESHPSPLGEGSGVRFEIDDDAIIPLMGSSGGFKDDAGQRIRNFIELVWGADTLTQNMNFLQQCLNKDLDEYLVKDFWKYHCRVYSKRPIYWLFSSPKGAFQVLVYMHRMNKFTADKIRTKYLLRHIQYLRNETERLSATRSSLNRNDERLLDKLRRDLAECEEYDLLLKDVASRQIEFDLDDGVVKNYALFKGVVAEIK